MGFSTTFAFSWCSAGFSCRLRSVCSGGFIDVVLLEDGWDSLRVAVVPDYPFFESILCSGENGFGDVSEEECFSFGGFPIIMCG